MLLNDAGKKRCPTIYSVQYAVTANNSIGRENYLIRHTQINVLLFSAMLFTSGYTAFITQFSPHFHVFFSPYLSLS